MGSENSKKDEKMSYTVRKIIATTKAPKPVAPYNQGILLNNTLYVSGVLGIDKDSMKLVAGGVVGQTRQALRSLGHILEEGGSSFDNVIKTTILLQNIKDFDAVNKVYEEFFKTDYPARCAYQVAALPLGALIEIEAIAASGEVRTWHGGASQLPSGGCGSCGKQGAEPESCGCKK